MAPGGMNPPSWVTLNSGVSALAGSPEAGGPEGAAEGAVDGDALGGTPPPALEQATMVRMTRKSAAGRAIRRSARGTGQFSMQIAIRSGRVARKTTVAGHRFRACTEPAGFGMVRA